MKIARALTLATAAFLSTGSAFAAPATDTFVSGTGTLDFQTNFLKSENLLVINTTSRYIDWSQLPPNAASYSPATRAATLTFDSASVSKADGKVTFTAGQSTLVMYAARQAYDDYDGSLPLVINLITLRNISFDLSDASVHADVSSYHGTSLGVSLAANLGRLAVFKGMAPITDGTQGLIVNGSASGSTTGGLMLAPESSDTLIRALYDFPGDSLSPERPLYMVASSMSWGVAKASGTFTSAVPEASTLSLMLLGLLPALALTRRSRQS